jgi:hypothetical protein
MNHSQRSGVARSWPAKGSVRLKRLHTYWLGFVFAGVLLGGGLAGMALGHDSAGGAGVALGGICLLAGVRDWFRHRHAARLGRRTQG